MKIIAKIEKFVNFNAMNVPCSNLQFGQLRDGKAIEVEDDIANELLAMGIVEKVTSKQKTKKGDK